MPHIRQRHRRAVALLTIAVAGLVLVPTSSARAAELAATPATFASTFAKAAPGDTIVLSAGDYGTFEGAIKAGRVTITAAPGATVTMNLNFNPAANLTFDGLIFEGIEMSDSATQNITIRNSTIPGQTVLRTGELRNANILFDRNVHGPWNKCSGCGEGRVFLPERTEQPSGITIQNSRFGPGGDSDGISNGSNGLRILNNEFVGIKQVEGGRAHADSIQLYGSKNTLIRGNWFHDVSVGVMAPDGADHEVIEDNVIQSTNPFAIQLGSDVGSIIRHNTLPDGLCEYNIRCGVIALGSKPGTPIGRNTTVTDNILGEISQRRADVQSHNLVRTCGICTSTDIEGLPTYTAGSNPASLDGFRLADGSLGKGSASDGLDRGIRLDRASSQGPTDPGVGAPSVSDQVMFTSKLQVDRARVLREERRLSVLAPITALASGEVEVEFFAAQRRFDFAEDVDAGARRVRFNRRIPAEQAKLGTGIMTITYPGDDDTRPQEVRLRAAAQKANLALDRPRIEDGHLKAQGTVSRRARGVVRLQLQYVVDGQTQTVKLRGRISDGRWSIDEHLSEQVRDGIARRAGPVHSYTLFTGYFPERIRGEMQSFQVLPAA